MADMKTAARNAAMVGGISYPQGKGVNYDEGLQKQYFAKETRQYAAKYGKIASDVYKGQSQGLDRDAFFDWTPVLLRSFSAAKSATGETMPDDWQRVHLLKPEHANELPPGAYLTYANNTWIVYKGTNIGSVLADAIVRRCNAVINTLDWYGNIVSVPMSYAKMGTLGNASHATENSIVAKNYLACVCQRNDVSAAFRENTRMILGLSAYSMRGVNDFTREFTEEPDSVHLMTFTIELSEVLPTDSIEKQCANYGSFRWDLEVSGRNRLLSGDQEQITVKSVRMGEAVESTEEHPISYTYASSDEAVVTVDENGMITAAGEGEATVTVSLEQNPEITAAFAVVVEEAAGKYLGFTSTVPDALREYESVTLSAAAYDEGEESSETLTWIFGGAPEACYGVTENEYGSRTVTCYAAAYAPLTVTISAEGYEPESVTIRLTAG